jgi:hypothetical protein
MTRHSSQPQYRGPCPACLQEGTIMIWWDKVPKQCCRRRLLSHSVVGAAINPRTWILTRAYDNHYGPRQWRTYGHFPVYSTKGHSSALWHTALSAGVGWDAPTCWKRPRHGPMRINEHAIPGMTCHVSRAGAGKRKTRLPRRTFSTFDFFLFLPFVTPAPPLVYKREGSAPH